MATLQLFSLTVAHGDSTSSNNPALKYLDWKRSLVGVSVSNPKTEALVIPAGGEKTVFDGTRPTLFDDTWDFDLKLHPSAPNRYRIDADRQNAAFKTSRNLDCDGVQLTLTIQSNNTMLITAGGAASPFGGLQSGDIVFIPGTLTGDPVGPFSVLNEGEWVVLASTNQTVTLTRPAGQDFSGMSQVVTPVITDICAYKNDIVQVGDKMEISAGFAANARRTYTIAAVTESWVEFISDVPLAAQADIIPTMAGLRFYSSGKKFIRIEADQDTVVRMNGDTTDNVKMSPWTAGDPALVAEFTKVGPTYSLKIVNKSSQTLNAVVISAE